MSAEQYRLRVARVESDHPDLLPHGRGNTFSFHPFTTILLSFYFLMLCPNKSNSRKKAYAWLMIPGYSPSLHEGQEGRYLKQLVTL